MTTLSFNLSAAIGRTLQKGDEVLITQLDHEGNRGPWLGLQERGVVVREVRLLESGELDAADMAAKITPRTKLFAIGASANSLGTVNDIALARRLTRQVGALLVVDAVHYAPHFRSTFRRSARIFCCARAINSMVRMWACCIRGPARSIGCRPTG